MKHRSLIEELIAFEEYMERKEEKAKTTRDKKKEPPTVHRFTFAEGMIVAYVAQFILPPIWKAVAHNMGLQ